MNEEEKALFNELRERVQKLEEENRALKTSTDLPLENENAIKGRGFIKGLDVVFFNATDFAATSDDIALSGDPENISVMGSADAWGRIVGGPFNGYAVPLYTLPRTF